MSTTALNLSKNWTKKLKLIKAQSTKIIKDLIIQKTGLNKNHQFIIQRKTSNIIQTLKDKNDLFGSSSKSNMFILGNIMSHKVLQNTKAWNNNFIEKTSTPLEENSEIRLLGQTKKLKTLPRLAIKMLEEKQRQIQNIKEGKRRQKRQLQ